MGPGDVPEDVGGVRSQDAFSLKPLAAKASVAHAKIIFRFFPKRTGGRPGHNIDVSQFGVGKAM